MTGADLLSSFPRAILGHWPTPLEPAPRLSAALGGPDLWIKRDDCSGLATGGNKTRKLEYLLGRALADGASGVVTFGALQSNHARQTAAACARLGLTCDLILVRAVERDDDHYLRSGNLLLDDLLGAELHVVDDDDAAFTRFASLLEVAESDGRSLYGIGPGGSDPIGTLGYVAAGIELADQAHGCDLDLGRVVVAASTAGTAAGLILGLAAAELDAVVDIACVYASADATEATLRRLLADTAETVGVAAPADDRWTLTDATLGGGYGVPTPDAMAAIRTVARTEGILLDPVYTAKAMAHLVACVEDGGWASDRDVAFLHTGGTPGLFAYSPSFGPSPVPRAPDQP